MSHSAQPSTRLWPYWKKFVFCFFFIYLGLNIIPTVSFSYIPGISDLYRFYDQFTNWAVDKANAKFFHVREVLVPMNGSGDTSFAWAQTWFNGSVALLGALVWRVIDRKRKNYIQLNYWLCLFTRYYIALVAFAYGTIKIFALQMSFPNLSQLATPLGDFLPMRLSWMFLGFSSSYQIFSGLMETLAGLLLLWRRTATLGALIATGVFLNVLMLNLSYDIPVKLFSIQIVLSCLYLVINEKDRLIGFFILNRPSSPCVLYDHPFKRKWMRITGVLLKIAFIVVALILPFRESMKLYKQMQTAPPRQLVQTGLYDVVHYVVNRDTIPPVNGNGLRWSDVIFDQGGSGSIRTTDTLFRQRYGRGYFDYEIDSLKDSLILSVPHEAPILLTMHFELPDSNTIRLRGIQKNDSLYVELKKSNHHYQLTEKQFHWLSEKNR
jgi:hypothetical protein